MQIDYSHEVDQSCRLVKGRQTNLCNAINELSQQVRTCDEAQLATFFVTKVERIRKTCLVDSELAMLKDQRSLQIVPKIDQESLDSFLRSIESIQLSVDNFGVTADLHDKFNAKQNDIAAFNEH